MTREEFLDFLERQVEKEKSLFKFKNGVYGYKDGTVFENFVRGSSVLDITPEKYLIHLVTKHFLAIAKTDFSSEDCAKYVLEYAQDIRMYMLLLMAMLTERVDKNAPDGD